VTGEEYESEDGEVESPEEDASYEDSTESTDESSAGTSTTSSASGFVQVDNESAAGKTLFLAHGICMALAWGLFVPLAVGASVIRSMSCLDKGVWFSMHLYCNMLAVLLTIAGFALGVVAAEKTGEEEHFKQNFHTKAGLAIFCAALVQAFLGYMRPHAPKAAAAPSKDASSGGLGETYIGNHDLNSSDDMMVDTNTEKQQEAPQKTPARLAWEIGHRLLGLALLGLAWYNCISGIDIYVEDYGTNEDSTALWNGLFWLVAGGIAAFVLLVGIYQRLPCSN
jgi:hypothetical protein